MLIFLKLFKEILVKEIKKIFLKKVNFLKIIIFISLVFILFILLLSLTFCKNFSNSSPFDLISNPSNDNLSSTNKTTSSIEDRQLFFKLKNSQKEKNPLSNINIRKSIFYAIDRERIIKELYGDFNDVLNSLFCDNSYFYNPFWQQYPYNIEKAKEFLNKAGYNNENPLYLTIVATNNSPSRIKIENIIKDNLNQIGIKLWIDNMSPDELYINNLKNGNFELGLWSIYTFNANDLNSYFNSVKIPVNETETNKNCNNFYWYKNDEVDTLLKKIENASNINEQKKYTDNIQEIVSENAIILPLFSRLFATAYNNKINNFEISSIDGNFFKNIENWSLKKDSNSNLNDKQFEITVGMANEPDTLNPFLEESTSINYINSLILRGLWSIQDDSSYKPELALDDNQINSLSQRQQNIKQINLKNDIYWQDGSPIVASDVKATIDAIKNDKSITKFRNDFDKIDKIEIINDKELLVYFKENIPDWKKLFLIIFPQKDLNKNKLSNLYLYDIFGCGPYKLKEWKRGEYITLTLNSNYYGKKPLVSNIKIIFNNNETLLINSLKKGDLDILALPIDPEIFNEIKNNKKLDLILKQGNLLEQLAICLKTK